MHTPWTKGNRAMQEEHALTEATTPEYKLFHNSKDCIAAIEDMINRATSSIDIESFYFIPDQVGRRILGRLVERAKEGLKVKILADSMGSFSLNQSLYIDALHKVGAQIRFFNSFLPFSKTKKTLWYFRNHRRAVIIDKTELLVGSFCIGEPTVDWIETSILIKNSSAILQADRVFKKTWHKCMHPSFKIGNSSKMSTDCFSYITQAPLQRQRYIYRTMVDDIKKAKRDVTLIAPYIVPDRRLVRAIKFALRKGVTVHLIAPRSSDSRLADYARNSYITKFMQRGVIVHFVDHMIHSKVTLIDRTKAYIGSMNLDNISLRYNYEATIITDSTNCVQELRTEFDRYINNPDFLVDAEMWHLRPLWTKFMEKLVWPVRKLL